MGDAPHNTLPPGLYEKLLSLADRDRLAHLADPRLALLAGVDAEDGHRAVAQYLERLLAGALSQYRGQGAIERQWRVVERVLAALREELGDGADQLSLVNPLQRLLAVHAAPEPAPARPDTPLSRIALLTGTRSDPSLASQLARRSSRRVQPCVPPTPSPTRSTPPRSAS